MDNDNYFNGIITKNTLKISESLVNEPQMIDDAQSFEDAFGLSVEEMLSDLLSQEINKEILYNEIRNLEMKIMNRHCYV